MAHYERIEKKMSVVNSNELHHRDLWTFSQAMADSHTEGVITLTTHLFWHYS